MKTIIALSLLICTQAFANGIEVYRFGQTAVAFKKVDALLVNRSCELPDCEALKIGIEHSETELDPEWLIGGMNPFSVRCKNVMGGNVVVGVDRKGNEQAFCHFKDDSYLR